MNRVCSPTACLIERVVTRIGHQRRRFTGESPVTAERARTAMGLGTAELPIEYRIRNARLCRGGSPRTFARD